MTTIELEAINGAYFLRTTFQDGKQFNRTITRERYIYLKSLLVPEKETTNE